MKMYLVLIAICALFCIGAATHDGKPGVGISLSSGYATVSARFSTGSYIDIAKIEGGERYKAYMFGSQEPETTLVAGYCPFSDRVCQSWPMKRIEVRNPLVPMLKALVAAAEVALDLDIPSVAVSVYSFQSINSTAVKHAGLDVHAWDRFGLVAPKLAPTLDPTYCNDPDQLIMTVEYTRNSLTAALWVEDCGVYDMQPGEISSAKLGYDAMESCVLTEQFSNGDSVNLSRVREFSPDPAFADSRALARADTVLRTELQATLKDEL